MASDNRLIRILHRFYEDDPTKRATDQSLTKAVVPLFPSVPTQHNLFMQGEQDDTPKNPASARVRTHGSHEHQRHARRNQAITRISLRSLGLRLLLDQPDQNECLPPGLIWSARRRRPDDNFKAKQK
jgi:hypothetical protein